MPDRAELIELHIPGLRRLARALLRGDTDGADDLVQDTLERALASWDRRRADKDPRSWLYTILYNRFRSQRTRLLRRGVHRQIDSVREEELPDFAGGQEAAVMYRDLLRGFAQLSAEQREVLFLISVEDLSYEGAARVLSIPTGTVMSRLSRGRERLRQYINGDRQLRQPELSRVK